MEAAADTSSAWIGLGIILFAVALAMYAYEWSVSKVQRKAYKKPKGNEVTRELTKDSHKATNGHKKAS